MGGPGFPPGPLVRHVRLTPVYTVLRSIGGFGTELRLDRLIPRDRVGQEQGDVHGVDGEHECEEEQEVTAHAVDDEDVLQHAGNNEIGEQRPAADLKETVPGEVL